MAKRSLIKEVDFVLLIVTMVLLMAKLPAMVEADMRVTFYNGMHNTVKMHCQDDYNGDHGYMWVKPTDTFCGFTVLSKSESGADYGGWHTWCGFETPGKPLTYVDVFVGTGGSANLPCDCFGKDCEWTISDWGIHCGAVPGRYVHKWGQPRQF
jgi:hypothetical protein